MPSKAKMVAAMSSGNTLQFRKRPVAIGRTVTIAAFYAATCQEHRITTGPMVAAIVLVDPRCAAELAHPDYQRFVQQSALLQIGEQHGQCPGRFAAIARPE